MKDEASWAYEIELAAVPAEGRQFELEPDAETRARLAAHAGVIAIPSLVVKLDVRPSETGADVTGTLSGTVRQTCVVSLETFESPISETIEVQFAQDPASLAGGEDEDEEDAELPDPIVDGKIDLGALVAEFLILGVDPYPRKPGVAFANPAGEVAPEPKASPFEPLSALKNGIKKQQ